MGTLCAKPAQSGTKKHSSKKPWYKNKATRTTILLTIAVLAFIAIFVTSLEIRMDAPVIMMTAHNFTNIIAFNANTGAFITTALLDMTYQKNLDLPSYVKNHQIQFRSLVAGNGEITVVNGHHHIPFIATFKCDNNPGWKLSTYFANGSMFAAHPYGLAWDDVRKWWIFTTQDTGSLFVYNETGVPLSLPGMKEHFPGAVFTLVYDTKTNSPYLDTYMPHVVKFGDESHKQKKADLRSKRANYFGLRGVAVDAELGLIFIAMETFGNVLVFDIELNFTNTYNITFGEGANVAPISVVSGAPYFPYTLFVTEKINNNGIYAVRYHKNGYSIWWQSERAPLLEHASGIAVSADSLFVLSQNKRAILRYSPYSGRYLSRVVHFANHDPSHIITHKGIGKVNNPVDNVKTIGEQLLYIPSGKACTVK